MTIQFTRQPSGSIQCSVSAACLPLKKGQTRIRATVPNLRIEKPNWKKGRAVITSPGWKDANDRLDRIEADLVEYLSGCNATGMQASPDRVREIIQGGPDSGDFFTLGKKYVSAHKATRSKATTDSNRKAFANVKAFVQETGYNLTVQNLSNNFFRLWREWCIKKGIADNSAKTYLAIIKAFLNWLTEHDHNVPQSFRGWKIDARAKKAIDLTQAEIHSLLTVDAGELQPIQDLARFQYLTGMRVYDTQNTAIQLDGDRLRFTPHKTARKTGKVVVQPVTDALRECIRNNRMKYNRHAPVMSVTYYNVKLKKLAELAGITQGVQVIREVGKIIREEKRVCDMISSHDLRHAAANHLIQSGATAQDVADFLGDKLTTVLNTYYHHNAEPNLESAARRIEKVDTRLKKAE